MTHYVHHVPGRLRIRAAALKRNEPQAKLAKERLQAIKGVTATEVSTVTGSIVIKYDASVVASTTLLESLKGLGYISASSAGIAAATFAPPPRRLAENLTEKVVGKLAEKVLERSAHALIASLI
jgi:copper chaperone CopZ